MAQVQQWQTRQMHAWPSKSPRAKFLSNASGKLASRQASPSNGRSASASAHNSTARCSAWAPLGTNAPPSPQPPDQQACWCCCLLGDKCFKTPRPVAARWLVSLVGPAQLPSNQLLADILETLVTRGSCSA